MDEYLKEGEMGKFVGFCLLLVSIGGAVSLWLSELC